VAVPAAEPPVLLCSAAAATSRAHSQQQSTMPARDTRRFIGGVTSAS
jgi:hypothetical protein